MNDIDCLKICEHKERKVTKKLKLKTLQSLNMVVIICKLTWCYIPEGFED
jgi:hypothetical protein